LNDFIPKKKIPVELIDESFEAATTGVEIWYVEKSEAIHGVIVPLPIKDGKRNCDYYAHEKLYRKTVSKEAHYAISQFVLARNLNPVDYLFASGNYWGDYYCYIDGSEDITRAVLEEFIAGKIRDICTPRTPQ
jgi:hypothetical protein